VGTIDHAVSELAVKLEYERPLLNEIGADVLEHGGQTIFPLAEADGTAFLTGKAAIFVGALNAAKWFEPNWERIEILDLNDPTILKRVWVAAKERAWLR
jgi:hypothetical protein